MAVPPSPSSQGKLQFHESRVLGNGFQEESTELSSHRRRMGLDFSLTKVPQEDGAVLNTISKKHGGDSCWRGPSHRDTGG